MDSEEAASRLIVALDFPAAETALAFVDRLGARLRWVKVGLELYLAADPTIVTELRRRGLRVFLDLKLHDIPNTVAGAVRAVAPLGAELLTVHTLGGPAMLAAAQAVASQRGTRLLGVTVLTSMDESQLRSIGINETPAAAVQRLAASATEAGLAGLVCSAAEVAQLRDRLGAEPILVVPGIRPAGVAANDQSRTATPADALRAGATLLVVGRPITQAEDPVYAFESIKDEIAASLG